MKKMYLGVAQIVLSAGIMILGIVTFVLETHLAAEDPARLAAQLKQAQAVQEISIQLDHIVPQHGKVLGNLAAALVPLQKGIDSVVELRDFTVMKKKPFFTLGNSFVGLQTSVKDVHLQLSAAQQALQKIDSVQSEALQPAMAECIAAYQAELALRGERKQLADYKALCGLVLFLLLGAGLMLNGIWFCARKEMA